MIEIANMVLGGVAAGMVLFIVSVGLSVTMGLMGFVNLGPRRLRHDRRLRHRAGDETSSASVSCPALALGFVVMAAISAVFERLLYSAALPRARARPGAVHHRSGLHHDRLGAH